VEFLVGVRRTKIEAGRYTAEWTRLNAGGRRRRVRALVVETRTGSQGRGASLGVVGDSERSLGVAGDSDSWGLDNRAADAPPLCFGRGGLPPAPRRSWRTRGRQ
jgi:hypothetical protein